MSAVERLEDRREQTAPSVGLAVEPGALIEPAASIEAALTSPPSERSARLRPLLALAPYVARYRGRVTLAFISLTVAAITTLIVPLAVRRMIDFGFTPEGIARINSYFSVMIAVVAVLALPVIVLPLVAFGRWVRRLSRNAQDTLADATAFASELVGAIRTVQAYTGERLANARFGGEVEQAYEAARSSTRARAVLTAIIIFIVFTSVVVILWIGSNDVLTGSITPGRLGQFVLYAAFAAAALGQLSEVWGEISAASGASERLFEILRVESQVTAPASPRALPQPARGDVSFENVSFAYPTRPDAQAVDGVSLSVRAGEKVAIVGPSGAGKSTLFHLLLRFYDPASGTISFDGVPIRTADPGEVRKRIALVPQESVVFAATARENIRFGRPEATDVEVERAADLAHAGEFIRRLPGGFDAQLGERGVTLSGGQRQRIAIARAILRDAPLLLLDEATSSLDAESETLVQTALEELMRHRTTLVIAHRLATVLSCDRIMVLDQGRIVEQGTHASLVAAGGLYARLARLQFEGV